MAGKPPVKDGSPRPPLERGFGEPERPTLGLLLVAALSVVPRLVSIRVNPVNYDGYWHVFIARNLPREMSSLAHPPLFPLLLRGADAIRHSRLSYVSISLVAGTVSVFLLGRALQKLCRRRATPGLGALALALSPSAIVLSGVAESYMLCVALVLAAFIAYLDLLGPGAPTPGARLAFATFATLALLSHYAAGLFLAASLAVPPLLAALEPRFRDSWKRDLPARLAADFATLLVPAAVAAGLLVFLARRWIHPLSHLPGFYFDPARETAGGFLARTLADTFRLFAPVFVASRAVAGAALLAFAGAVVAIAVAADRRRPSFPPAATPAVLLVALLLIEIGAALRGWYPFGGAMRHQILLMVFGLLAVFVALDRILDRRSAAARGTLTALAVAAIAGNWWGHFEHRWRPRPEPFSAERARFDRDFPQAREVHVDQFNLVGFFAQHHDWNWEFVGAVAGHPGGERYRLTSGDRKLDLVAHRDLWNIDPLAPASYQALSAVADPDASHRITLYALHQFLPGATPPADEELRHRIPTLARDAGLEVERLDVFDANVFAEFRSPPRRGAPDAGSSSAKPAAVEGR
ncbi:MAG: hypothetical protein ACM3NW_07060 [Syntrophomonadaceae bacterium]